MNKGKIGGALAGATILVGAAMSGMPELLAVLAFVGVVALFQAKSKKSPRAPHDTAGNRKAATPQEGGTKAKAGTYAYESEPVKRKVAKKG